MKKIILFLMTLVLAVSCKPGEGPTNPGGGQKPPAWDKNPDWFLTQEQQDKEFYFESKPFEPTPANKYRIPAVVVADNGNIIVFADDRYAHGSDIGFGGGAIDIVYRISRDGGKTWGDKKIILPLSTPGADENNKGDPVAFKAANGDIVVLAVAGGAWFSAPTVPSVLVMSRSTDNGETWSKWKKVGEDTLWNSPLFTDGFLQRKAFTASGKGLTLEGRGNNRKGRLMAAMLVSITSGGQGALTIYSDDNGETWHPGGLVTKVNQSSAAKGQINEPKIIAELNDGTIVMSVRNADGYWNSTAPRLYALSTDGGESFKSREGTPGELSGWQDMHDADVNADGIVWTRKKEHGKDRMVHIISDGPARRRGLALYLSEDEGKTFKRVRKLIQDSEEGCYATTGLLPDGTIITVSEEKPANGGYTLMFRRYNLKLLTGEAYDADLYKDWYLTAPRRR